MIFWTLIFLLTVIAAAVTFAVWRRGMTVQQLVRNPPPEVDLPQFVTTLGYLHHELIKHRLPLVRTVADQPLHKVDETDVEMLKQAVTGAIGRPSLVGELESYLGGLRRAAGRVHLNFGRDVMMRRARNACEEIQSVAEGLGARSTLTRQEHRRLRHADDVLDGWFRPRLQALRNSVLSFELTAEIFEEPIERVVRELGLGDAQIERPQIPPGLYARMLRSDFNLAVRNLVRNGLQRSMEATGQARLAIDVRQRVELTGEESILIRIHDADPTIMTRQQLYGGQIGRGLNLVTTTLRRYDGALSCHRSRLDGFAKALEIRLFQAHADPAEVALLGRPEPLTWAVPSGLAALVLAAGAVCGAGFVGALPDPLEKIGLLPTEIVDTEAQEALREARKEAAEQARAKTDGAINVAEREALVATPSMARHKVPGPKDIEVDARRCAQPLRVPRERRLELNCHLVDTSFNLQPPVLLLDVARPFDVSTMKAEIKDLVRTSDTVEPGEPCSKVLLLGPGRKIPDALAERLPPSVPRTSAFSRILFDYQGCLALSHYPVQAKIIIGQANTSDELPDHPSLKPITIDLSVQLRRMEEAAEVYAKISNDDTLTERSARSDLARSIALQVAQEITYARDAGLNYSQKDLGQALYFGWVRPGIYDGLWSRVELTRARKGPTKEFCALYGQTQEGYDQLKELDPKVVSKELYRSQYYFYHARLWILGDVPGVLHDFEAFQRTQSRQTDFVQGARLYMALLLALSPPPAKGSEENPEDARRVAQLAGLFKDLLDDARKGSKRGLEYDRVKLLGWRALVGPGDEGFMAEDVVCAFGQIHAGWRDALSDADFSAIFSHCPDFRRRASPAPPGDLDPDNLDPDLRGEPDPAPESVIPENIERAARYVSAFDELMRAGRWSCEP